MRDTYARSRARERRGPKSRSPWRGDMCRRRRCGTRRGLESEPSQGPDGEATGQARFPADEYVEKQEEPRGDGA